MLEQVTFDWLDGHYNQWNNTGGNPNSPRKAYMDAYGQRQISQLDTYEFDLLGVDKVNVYIHGESQPETYLLSDYAYIEAEVRV